jgi:hypothetical protein
MSQAAILSFPHAQNLMELPASLIESSWTYFALQALLSTDERCLHGTL